MRMLLIGGGCRGLGLAETLIAGGHAVRLVTRDEANRARIERVGAECWIGDPDVVGTLRYALDGVTVLVWALGTAAGTPEQVGALHGSRLQMMLSKTIDTTVRGVLYEAAGSLPAATLAAGAAEVRRACELNEIPFAIIDADPGARDAWVAGARAAIERLLGD